MSGANLPRTREEVSDEDFLHRSPSPTYPTGKPDRWVRDHGPYDVQGTRPKTVAPTIGTRSFWDG